MSDADQKTIPKWSDIAASKDFQEADWETKQAVRGRYFDRVVRPNTPANLVEEVQSRFFTRTEGDVFGEREEQQESQAPDVSYRGARNDQQALENRERVSPDSGDAEGLAGRSAQNTLNRGTDLLGGVPKLAGRAVEGAESWLDRTFGRGAGIIGGEVEAMRERGYDPDVSFGGYGLDFTSRANPEDTSLGLEQAGQAIQDTGTEVENRYGPERFLEDPSLANAGGMIAEQGPAAAVDMAAMAINLPAYMLARTQEIAEERAGNPRRERPTLDDYLTAGPTAAASVALDRLALDRLLPGTGRAITQMRQVPGAAGRGLITEGITEAAQEGGIEYAGATVGTERGWDAGEAGTRAVGGAIVGAPVGGGVAGVSATIEATREQAARAGGDALAQTMAGQQAEQTAIADQALQEEAGQQANQEAATAAADLVRRPRTQLSDAEREARDSITHGDGYQALRTLAEQRGDTEAVAELDAIREEAGMALEEETLAATNGDQDGMARVQKRLSGTGDRLARVVQRLNDPEAQPAQQTRRQAPQSTPEDFPAQSPTDATQTGILSGAMNETQPLDTGPMSMPEPQDTGLPGVDASALDVNQPAAGEPQDQQTPTGERQDRQPAPPLDPRRAQTGQPIRATGYRVNDIAPDELYAGAQTPVMGQGAYVAPTPEDAKAFTRNQDAQVAEQEVSLDNPLVIRGDNEWRALTKEAGWDAPNPSGKSKAEVEAQTQALQEVVRSRGHDGIAVLWNDDTMYDMDEETGKPIKTLRNVFSKPQLVDFKGRQPAAEPQAQAERPAPQARQADSDGLLRKANGTPFATERSAKASKPFRDNPGATIEPIDGGFAIRPAQAEAQESAPASDVRGEQIDDEWTAFSDDSGTRGVPRSSMPQVKAEHRGALANFLNARGIDSAEDTVPAISLQPTQAEFSEAKVQQAKERTGGDRAILVSSDGHILDGHHQWMARRDQGEDVRVIRLDAPIDQLVDEIQEFPSSELEGEQEAAQDADDQADAEQDAAQDEPRYRQTADGEMTWSAIDRMIRPLRAEGLAVEVVVNEDGLPKPLRDKIRRDGVEGMVAGVYYNRTTWLVADNLRTPKQVMETVLHETVGHQGVMKVLGDDLGRVMDNIYRDMPRRTREELERRYAGQLRNQSPEKARRTVAEEHVAHLAETDPQSTVLDRVISAVRMALRRLFGPNAAREWGRREIVDLIAQARGAMAGRGRPEGEARYSLNTESEAFENWFDNSKVVDKKTGEPLVVYHGTPGDSFTVFGQDRGDGGGFAGGQSGMIYFTPSKRTAADHAYWENAEPKQADDVSIVQRNGNSRVLPAYLSIQNPLYEGTPQGKADLREAGRLADEAGNTVAEQLQAMGYDGILPGRPGADLKRQYEIMAFRPEQVKSAIGNNGDFDPANPDIRYALKPRPVSEEAIRDIGDASALDQTMPFAQAGEYRNNRALKADLQERVKAAAKRHKVDLEAVNTEIEKVLTETGVRDAKEALKSNANAVGWYDETVSKALEIVSLIHPEILTDERSRFAFTYALAVTSNGIKVDKNFQLAEKAYRDFKRDGVMPTNIQAGQAQKSINDSMGLFNDLRERFGDDTFRDFMLSEFTVAQLNRMGFKITGEQAATQVRGAAILGPKIGNGFFSNLYGHFDALTMDRWLMRTWGRWTGTLIDARPDMVKTKRAELKDAVREMRQDKAATKAFEEALGAKLQLTNMDYLAQRIQKASVSPEVRKAFNQTPTGETIRKVGNSLAKWLDGQKEAPTNGKERNWIRKVFGNVLERLRGDGYEQLTMSDLQALLWYPERRLYDMAKGDEGVEAGYADDEAPDYANAAADLARDNGVPEADIQRAIEEVTGDATEGRSARAGRSDGRESASRAADDARGRRASEERDQRGFNRRERSRFLKREIFVAARLGRGRDATSRSFSRKSGGADRKVRGVIASFKPMPKFANVLRDAELGSVELEELSPTDENVQRFSDAITASKEGSEFGAAVYVYPQDEYREMRLFMTPDGGSGLAIKPDGDIVSVYTDGGAKVHAMLTLAVEEGGTKLDAFDTVLPALYGVNGFKEVARDLWNEQYRPEGWDKQVFREFNNGEPDVVYMTYDPDYNPYYDGEGEPRYSLNGETDEGRPESTRDRGGRDRGREKAPLEGAPTVRGAAGPDPELNRVAEQYAQEQGIDLRRQAEYVEVDVERAERIADAYEAMEHAPQDPRVQEAYQNLIRQTRAQYDALVDAGYEFYLFDGDQAPDPYDTNPWNAMRDLRANKRMGVFSTEAGFGSDEDFDPSNNPLLEDTGLRWPLGEDGPLVKVLANDLFRAVHDAFGHGLEGAGFRARGEENAWQAHARLFTGSALGALTSETRGQNSLLNFGSQLLYKKIGEQRARELYGDGQQGRPSEEGLGDGQRDRVQDSEGLPALREMERDDGQVLQPEVRELQALRSQGDNGSPGSADASGVRGRDGAPSNAEASDRQEGQRRPLRAGESPVGDEFSESPQSAPQQDADLQGRDEEYQRVGRGDRDIDSRPVGSDREVPVDSRGGPRDAEGQGRAPLWKTITVGEHNRTAGLFDTVFADQKTGLMPEWTWTEGRADDAETDSEPRYSLEDPVGGPYTRDDSTNFAMPDETYMDVFLRNIADKFRSVKRLQQAITQSGGRVNDDNDTYLAEELYYGRAETDLRRLEEGYIKPLVDGLARAEISQADLDTFLYARHAPERNARIAERNPDNEAMQDGGSGMTDAEAEQVMEVIDQSGKREQFERLASIVDEMLAQRREAIRDGGLMDDEMMGVVMGGFDHYVPLKGWARDEDVPVGEDGSGRPATGRGFEASGKESKIALGRRTVAASPSTQAIVDTTEALIKRRKNEVAQALLSLVTDNPNPKLWQVFTQDNPDMEAQPVRRVDPETGRRRTVAQQMPVPMAMSDRYFKAKKNGETYYIKIHHQQLMDALRNVGTNNAGAIVEHMASVVRVMSSLVTSYNPEFMVNNFIRDAQTALLNIQAEQSRDDGRLLGKKIGWAVARDMKPAMRAAYRGLTGKPAREGEAGEWDRWFEEFMEAGGKTGYFDTKDVERQARDLKRMMKMAQGGAGGATRKAAKTITDFVENMNGAVENAVRLAAYANARRQGLTKKRAASMAKNMTVNFNRRGEMSTTLGAMYMFFNAAVQGTANFVRTMGGLKNPAPGTSRGNVWKRFNTAQKIAVGMTAGAFLNAMLQRMLSDEDDDEVKYWDKVPDFEKERNLVFMTGWATGEPKDYVKVPLPYGYNVFAVMGTQAEAVAMGGKDVTDAGVDLTLALLGSFNPIGFEDSEDVGSLIMKNASPTIVRSVAQVAVNEDFAGRMIYKENLPFGTPLPDSSLSFRSTPEAYKSIVEFLNKISGGNEFQTGNVDISPDTLQHVVNFYGGGAWSFTEKVADAGIRSFTGEEIKPYRRPFLGRVMGEADDKYDDQSRFYERADELGQRVNYIESREGPERRRLAREERDVLRMFNRATSLRQRLSELRKLRDRAEQSDRLPEARRDQLVEQYESRMKERIDAFNREYNDLFEAD